MINGKLKNENNYKWDVIPNEARGGISCLNKINEKVETEK